MKAELLIACVIVLGSVGCSRIPAINAKLVRYESSYPIGGSSITIKDIETTPAEVKAGEYHRVTKLWGFSQSVAIEGYARQRTPADATPANTPAALAP